MLLLGLLLAAAARGTAMVPGDLAIGRLAQSPPSPALDHLAVWLSAAGSYVPATIGAATVVVLVCLRRRATGEALWMAAASVAGGFNVLLKLAVASPRPDPAAVRVVVPDDGYGFPSGHVFGAVLVYGTIWLVLPLVAGHRPGLVRAARVVLPLFVLGVAWSRVRLGDHWPSDVLGAMIWGGAVLALLAAAFRPLVGPGEEQSAVGSEPG